MIPVIRIIAIAAAMNGSALLDGDSTAQRDAPTVRFYSTDGRIVGSASIYGNTTKFYSPDGKLVGSATSNGKDKTR
jgi:hypothetical protein